MPSELERAVERLEEERAAAANSLSKAVILTLDEASIIHTALNSPKVEVTEERIYAASRASLLERGAMWRKLRSEGAPIISSWIDEDGPKASRDLSDLWRRIRQEVTSATRLILYVEPDDFPLKGALVEIGMAIAASVPITIIAPNVAIEARNCRPFGSWITHPSVSFAPSILAALAKPDQGEG